MTRSQLLLVTVVCAAAMIRPSLKTAPIDSAYRQATAIFTNENKETAPPAPTCESATVKCA